jgi:hypothetical protein
MSSGGGAAERVARRLETGGEDVSEGDSTVISVATEDLRRLELEAVLLCFALDSLCCLRGEGD